MIIEMMQGTNPESSLAAIIQVPLTTTSTTTTAEQQEKQEYQQQEQQNGASSSSRHNDNDENNDKNNNNNMDDPVVVVVLNRARHWIYVSHFFAQFSDAAWQFALSLFLAALTNYQSLFWVSSYGIVTQLSVCGWGATSGRWVDQSSNRLWTARWFLGLQTACVLTATVCSCLALRRVHNISSSLPSTDLSNGNNDLDDVDGNETTVKASTIADGGGGIPLWNDGILLVLLLLIHIFGPLAELLSQGFLVAMERDWIVAMAPQPPSNQHSYPNGPGEEEKDDGDDDQKDSHEDPNDSSNTHEWLTETNVRMRQLDLACKVAAPAVAGWVIGAFDETSSIDSTLAMSSSGSSSGADPSNNHWNDDNSNHGNLTSAALLVGMVNLVAVIVEYVCTARVYTMVPALQRPPSRHANTMETSSSNNHNPEQEEEQEQAAVVEEQDSKQTVTIGDDLDPERRKLIPLSSTKKTMTSPSSWSWSCCILPIFHHWREYFQQPIAYGGLALAILYINVLSFGPLMTAYLVSEGMALETVGLLRGISAALGLLGTVAYHVSVTYTTLVTTGLWSILLQFFCLSLCLASFFIPSSLEDGNTGSLVSTSLLVSGVWFSRIGLWVFDITITQMMQELIPPGIRGVVGGTQQSLNAIFNLIAFSLGLLFPNPSNFSIYGAAGYLAVGVGLILYFVGVYRRAAHLFPPLPGKASLTTLASTTSSSLSSN